jgi:DNA-binding XRE family transcriptional regulator
MSLTRKQFSAALRSHRERLGLTQTQAAKLCEVSSRVWWKWENSDGDSLPVTMEGVLARLKGAQPKTK